jgi:CO dehydrogenase nickel-insertion accessory protein CooC1
VASPNLLILHYNCLESIKAIRQHPKLVAYMSDISNNTDSIIHIVEPSCSEIIESKEFKDFIYTFSENVNHVIYNRKYMNKNYDMAEEPVPQHMNLVSFVHKFSPSLMPDILKQHRESL